jgi:lipopolysaccharide export system permease protein
MPLIERYILRRVSYIFLLTFGALIATLWVTQALRELDVVTAKGQAIWMFLVMTLLALPALAQVIAPIAFLAATVITLNSLTSDGELPVISAAGASRRAVNRPILLLGAVIMIAIAISHHVVAPAALSALRGLLMRVRADVIATLVQDGGFRTVEDGLTMHIREKAPDGSFRDIFVNDDRDPSRSLQYTAAEGMLLERAGGSFLVLRNGDLIREDRVENENNVVAFETYALDLSNLGAPNAAAVYKAKERSTLYLMEPGADDTFAEKYPLRMRAELHERITAPLYAIAFASIALAFLGRPRTNRQDRSFAIATVVLLCLIIRAGGFAAAAAAGTLSGGAILFMYAIPLGATLFGWYVMARQVRMRIPRAIEAVLDALGGVAQALTRRFAPAADPAGGERR